MEEFERELKQGFLDEATQLLADVEQCFLALEQNPNDQPTLEKIFRLAHNLKGGSKAVGFDDLGTFTHEFESFLLKCKNGAIPITAATVSLMLKCNDHICKTVEILRGDLAATIDNTAAIQEIHNFDPGAATVAEATDAPSAEESISPEEILALQALEQQASLASEPVVPLSPEVLAASPAETPVVTDTPAAPSAIAPTAPESNPTKAEAKAESPSSIPAPAPAPAPEAAKAAPAGGANQPAGAAAASDESIRVSLSRLERLLNFVGELVIMQTVLKEQAFNSDTTLLRRTVHQMGKVTKEIQDLSTSLRMVPLKQTFQKMQRIVRDTSNLLQKKVQFEIEGEDTEVDKTVLEALSDPLVHLVRNAVDHGIESPADRVAKGKAESGTIRLRAYHQGGRLVIEVVDNGGGISADRLRAKAMEKGILKPGQTISEQDAINLIFHPGFSTKAEVTEVSGRGVGMDVVKTNIEKMQGQVIVSTKVGEGSVFKVTLPLTMAIIDGMVVRCGEERFVIPLSHVHESVRPGPNDLYNNTGLGEVLHLRGQSLPVLRLGRALGRKPAGASAGGQQIAVIIHSNGQPFATLVDDVVGQYQVVIKKLGAEVQHIKGYSGTAILGDGKPALILELNELALNQKIGKQVA
jgi:two-component system, chemotaxis family, sensor kinase CheA